MIRWIALLALVSSAAVADDFAPVYEGPHVTPTLHLPRRPPDLKWSDAFQQDTNVVLAKYGWYVAELAIFVDETGQVRETLITESMPSLNLSATMVDELRRHKFIAGRGPNGTVAGIMPLRVNYMMQQQLGDLGAVGGRLRSKAAAGDATAQYMLSRIILNDNVAINTTGLNSEDLTQKAAAGGNRRAMLSLSAMSGEVPAGADPAAVTAERRAWLLKSATAGYGPAQVLVALDAWAEQTAAGHARARHWLELANKAKDPVAPKYLAALLVSHSENPADWKEARKLLANIGRDWHARKDPDAWQIQAAALAATGDFAGAVTAQSKAIDLATDAQWPLDVFERRLATYKESHAVREEIVLVPVVARVVLR